MKKLKEYTPKLISKCTGEGKVLDKVGQGRMFISVCVCMCLYVLMQLYGYSMGKDGKQ